MMSAELDAVRAAAMTASHEAAAVRGEHRQVETEVVRRVAQLRVELEEELVEGRRQAGRAAGLENALAASSAEAGAAQKQLLDRLDFQATAMQSFAARTFLALPPS